MQPKPNKKIEKIELKMGLWTHSMGNVTLRPENIPEPEGYFIGKLEDKINELVEAVNKLNAKR